MAPDLHVALVGYGLAGRMFHAPLIDGTPGLRLSAVVTSNAARAAQVHADLPGTEVIASPSSLWPDADEYDLVVVAAANVAHEPLTRAAVEHGLNVVVDKPLARDARAARGLVALARHHHRQLHIFQNRRWDSDFRTLRALVEDGTLGRVHRFESRFERWRPAPSGAWRESSDPDALGGLLYDLGSHLVDQAVQLLGPVESVYAEMRSVRDPDAADDDTFVALRHRNHAVSHLWASAVAAEKGPRLRALGSLGAYVVNGLDGQEEALRSGRRPGPGWGEEPPEKWGRLLPTGEAVPSLPGAWPGFYRAVEASLRGVGHPPVDLDGVLDAITVLDAARASASRGSVVRVPA